MTKPDIIYPIKAVGANEELRFSLRSLKNIAHGKVFIGGSIPQWVQNVEEVPVQPYPANKKISAYNNLRAVLERKDLSEDIIVMNDDMYFLEPINKVPIVHGVHVGFSVWKSASRETTQVMKKLGCWAGHSYEQHIPFACKKSKLKHILDYIPQVIEDYGKVYWRTVYGNYYRIGGELTQDVKVRMNPVILPGQKFISSEDTTFEKHLKPILLTKFIEKSIYEKY